MNTIKKGLGRGLSSLIGETKVETKTNKLLLSEIIPNKYQPRKNRSGHHASDDSNLTCALLWKSMLCRRN